MLVDSEVQSLITLPAKHHECATVFAQFDDLDPQLVSHSCGHTTAEDSGAYLKEPAGEVPPKPSWASGQHHDYHGKSTSA